MLLRIVRLLLPLLPRGLGFALTRSLASIPSKPPVKAHDREVLGAARRIAFGVECRKVAWIWGEGPPVVFVHGWGGRAGQMAGLAKQVADNGFRVVVFDVRAHGESAGRRVSFRHFIDDLAELVGFLGVPIHALVGHSAGALCMMAARELRGLRAAHYVGLCAPRAPYVPVREIQQRLNPREGVLRRCEAYYAAQFDRSWQDMDQGGAFRYAGQGRLLLIYDRDDPRVDHGDGACIQAVWPSAQIITTRGLGHQKVLWDPGIAHDVIEFLRDAPLQRDVEASRDMESAADPHATSATIVAIANARIG